MSKWCPSVRPHFRFFGSPFTTWPNILELRMMLLGIGPRNRPVSVFPVMRPRNDIEDSESDLEFFIFCWYYIFHFFSFFRRSIRLPSRPRSDEGEGSPCQVQTNCVGGSVLPSEAHRAQRSQGASKWDSLCQRGVSKGVCSLPPPKFSPQFGLEWDRIVDWILEEEACRLWSTLDKISSEKKQIKRFLNIAPMYWIA